MSYCCGQDMNSSPLSDNQKINALLFFHDTRHVLLKPQRQCRNIHICNFFGTVIMFYHNILCFLVSFTPPDVAQQHNCTEEEVLADLQLCNQERNTSLDCEDKQVLCTSQKGEPCVLKEETDSSKVTTTYQSNQIKPESTCDIVVSHNSPPWKQSLKCKPCAKRDFFQVRNFFLAKHWEEVSVVIVI